MKRSTWIAAAVAVISLTLTVESATAQYYHQRPQRHYGGGGGNNNIGAFVAGLVGGAVIGALISSQTRNAMRVASPRMYDLDIEDGYRSEFDGDGHRGYYEVVDQGRTDRYNLAVVKSAPSCMIATAALFPNTKDAALVAFA